MDAGSGTPVGAFVAAGTVTGPAVWSVSPADVPVFLVAWLEKVPEVLRPLNDDTTEKPVNDAGPLMTGPVYMNVTFTRAGLSMDDPMIDDGVRPVS